MRHGNVSRFESKATATYIDRIFDGPVLMPRDARGAAVVEQWVSAVNTSIFPTAVIYMQANAFPKGPNGECDESVVAEAIRKISLYIEIKATYPAEILDEAGNELSEKNQ